MKHHIFLLLFFVTGCVTQVKGKPFVDIKSGEPYSTLKIADKQANEFFILIDTIDGRRSMKDALFGEELYAAKETYVEPGKHTILADCRNGIAAGKYLQAELTFIFKKNKIYTVNCHADTSNNHALFSISDENGKNIEFSYKKHKD